jgi:hypothetical protein
MILSSDRRQWRFPYYMHDDCTAMIPILVGIATGYGLETEEPDFNSW